MYHRQQNNSLIKQTKVIQLNLKRLVKEINNPSSIGWQVQS